MSVHSLFLSKLNQAQRHELMERLFSRQNGVCFLCEENIDLNLQRDTFEIDHIIPIASDGKDEENNFALTHETCNRRKSSSDLRVARIMEHFARIEKKANSEGGRGANLGHVLEEYGGAKELLRLEIGKESVRFTIPTIGGVPITTVPLWHDPLSGMQYCFIKLPITHLHHDDRINPRSIGVNIRGLVEEFSHKRPQLQVALAWWSPDSGDEGKVHVFELERDQMVRLMSIFSEVFFIGNWDQEVTGNKLEDRLLKGEPVPSLHLRAWRVAREEVIANILKWVRLAIEHYYAFNQEMVDKNRLLQSRIPEVVWTSVETLLRNIGDLPCWIDKKLAQTIFGGKPNRDFWRKIFTDGVSPTGIRVLAEGLNMKSLITPKGGVKSASQCAAVTNSKHCLPPIAG